MRKLALILTLLLVASACATTSGTDDSTTTTVAGVFGSGGVASSAGTDTTVDGSADSTTTTSSSPSTTTTITVATTTVPIDGTVAGSCFVGVWVLDSQRFFNDVVAMSGAALAGATIEVRGGANVLTLSNDGTMLSERRAWSWAMIMDVGELQVTATASQQGTYTIDGDVATANVGTGEPPVIEMLLDGKPIPNLPNMEMQNAADAIATLRCEGDVLTGLSEDGFTSYWSRS